MPWLKETCCQESNILSLLVLTLPSKHKTNSFYFYSIVLEEISASICKKKRNLMNTKLDSMLVRSCWLLKNYIDMTSSIEI